jgi:hypothetical protein
MDVQTLWLVLIVWWVGGIPTIVLSGVVAEKSESIWFRVFVCYVMLQLGWAGLYDLLRHW